MTLHALWCLLLYHIGGFSHFLSSNFFCHVENYLFSKGEIALVCDIDGYREPYIRNVISVIGNGFKEHSAVGYDHIFASYCIVGGNLFQYREQHGYVLDIAKYVLSFDIDPVTYFIGTLYYNKEPGSKAQYHLLKCKGNAGPYQAQRDTIRMTFQSSFLKCLDIVILRTG